MTLVYLYSCRRCGKRCNLTHEYTVELNDVSGTAIYWVCEECFHKLHSWLQVEDDIAVRG